MTVHVASVGITLLDALRKRGSDDRESARWGAAAAAVDHHRKSMLNLLPREADVATERLAAWFPPTGSPSPQLRAPVREVRPEVWPPSVTAELQTLHALKTPRPLVRQDIAVLIASDTADGLTAALWNAFALTGNPDLVRFLPDPKEPLVPPHGGVLIARIPGLEVSTDSGFRRAMRGLGALGRNLLFSHLSQGEECRFYLSGGYKATIPYLIGMAEAMRYSHNNVTAYIQHESTVDSAIRVPLRVLEVEHVRLELAAFDADGYAQALQKDRILEGYAYEQERSRHGHRLTGFGEGLRILISDPPQVVAG